MSEERAQVVIIVAVLLMVVLLLFAVIIDGSRLMWERQRLNRAADAAGKAGLVVVGDHMVTQVVGAQTVVASLTPSPTNIGGTPNPTPTTMPAGDDFYAWLDDEHRATLVAPAMRTVVARYAIGYAEDNELGPSHPQVTSFEVIYPYQYHPADKHLSLLVRITRKVSVVFGSLFGMSEGVLTGNAKQSIPQR